MRHSDFEDDYPTGIEPSTFPTDAPLTFGEKCVSITMAFLFAACLFWGIQFLADKFGWTL